MKTRNYTLTAKEFAKEVTKAKTEEQRKALLTEYQSKDDEVRLTRYCDK